MFFSYKVNAQLRSHAGAAFWRWLSVYNSITWFHGRRKCQASFTDMEREAGGTEGTRPAPHSEGAILLKRNRVLPVTVTVTEADSLPDTGCGDKADPLGRRQAAWASSDLLLLGLGSPIRVLECRQGFNVNLVCVSTDPGMVGGGVRSPRQDPCHCGANVLPGETRHKPEGYREQSVLRTHAG